MKRKSAPTGKPGRPKASKLEPFYEQVLSVAPIVIIGLLGSLAVGALYERSDLKKQIDIKAKSLFGDS